jgi:hypothetical protein
LLQKSAIKEQGKRQIFLEPSVAIRSLEGGEDAVILATAAVNSSSNFQRWRRPAGPDFGEQWPSRLVATAAADCLKKATKPILRCTASLSVSDNKPTTRTHFVYRIDIWTDDGKNILEHLAGIENLIVARAAYRAACERWPTQGIRCARAGGSSKTVGAEQRRELHGLLSG